MPVRIVLLGQQFPDVFTRPREISSLLEGQGQIVLIAMIGRFDLVGGLQQRNRLSISAGMQIERAELMVCCKTAGSAGQIGAQPAFGFVPWLERRLNPPL